MDSKTTSERSCSGSFRNSPSFMTVSLQQSYSSKNYGKENERRYKSFVIKFPTFQRFLFAGIPIGNYLSINIYKNKVELKRVRISKKKLSHLVISNFYNHFELLKDVSFFIKRKRAPFSHKNANYKQQKLAPMFLLELTKMNLV